MSAAVRRLAKCDLVVPMEHRRATWSHGIIAILGLRAMSQSSNPVTL
jgi:hypothetical protein